MLSRAILALTVLLVTGCTDSVQSNMYECELEALKQFGTLRTLHASSGRLWPPTSLEYDYRYVCMEARGFIFDNRKKIKDDEALRKLAPKAYELQREAAQLERDLAGRGVAPQFDNLEDVSRWHARYWKRDYFRSLRSTD